MVQYNFNILYFNDFTQKKNNNHFMWELLVKCFIYLLFIVILSYIQIMTNESNLNLCVHICACTSVNLCFVTHAWSFRSWFSIPSLWPLRSLKKSITANVTGDNLSINGSINEFTEYFLQFLPYPISRRSWGSIVSWCTLRKCTREGDSDE